MAKHNFGKYVKCPFYKYEDQQLIYCEGVDDNTAIHLAFASKQELRDYRKDKCEGDYNSCLLCKMLYKKYYEGD